MLKTITPNYQVNLAWTTIKLRSSITFRLKPEVPYLEKSGVVYSFQCYCPAIYVGETKRKLESRIRDHNQGSRATAVYTHIKLAKPSTINSLKLTECHLHLNTKVKIAK